MLPWPTRRPKRARSSVLNLLGPVCSIFWVVQHGQHCAPAQPIFGRIASAAQHTCARTSLGGPFCLDALPLFPSPAGSPPVTLKTLAVPQVEADVEAELGVDMEHIVWSISDALRYTLMVDTQKYTQAVLAAVARLEQNGIKPVSLKNYWGGGDG